MHSFAKRAASFLVAGALAFTGLAGLAGCGGGQAEPTTAKEVAERYAANEKHNNYHADTTANFEASVLGQSITATLTMATDAAGNNSHGTMKVSVFGTDEESEVYVEKTDKEIVQYTSTGTGSDKSWTKSVVDSASLSEALTSGSAISDGEFKKTDNGYEVVISGTKLMDAMKTGNMDVEQMLGDVSDEGLKDALEKSTATCTFDKDCLLTSVTYELPYTMTYGDSSSSSSDALSLSAEMNIKVNVTLSNYGGVDASSVTVPDDVKNNALDTDAALEEVSAVLEGITGDSASSSADSAASAESTSSAAAAASAA